MAVGGSGFAGGEQIGPGYRAPTKTRIRRSKGQFMVKCNQMEVKGNWLLT